MRIISVLFLSVLLCTSNLNAQNPDNGEPIGDSLLYIKKEKNRLEITDLDVDVLFVIFQNLGFMDLLNLAETNSTLSLMADEIFRKRNYEIIISDCNRVNEDERRIEITGIAMISNVFKYFTLTNIDVKNLYIEANISALVSQYINEYARGTLRRLKLTGTKEDTFEQFTIPFEELKEFSFSISKSEFRPSNLPLNQLFPKLRILNITFASKADLSYVVCKLPYLDYLNVHIQTETARSQAHQIEAFLCKNSHVRNIEILMAPKHLISLSLRKISELLPNIEFLKLNTLVLSDEPAHFNHVKHFVLDDNYPRSVNHVTFSCLESLTMKYYSSSYGEWNHFFRQNSNLTRLNMLIVTTDGDTSNSIALMGLATGLLNLVEMKIRSFRSINVRMIQKFIENHPRLMKLQFEGPISGISSYEQKDLDDFQKQYENEWHIQSCEVFTDLRGLSMERKIEK